MQSPLGPLSKAAHAAERHDLGAEIRLDDWRDRTSRADTLAVTKRGRSTVRRLSSMSKNAGRTRPRPEQHFRNNTRTYARTNTKYAQVPRPAQDDAQSGLTGNKETRIQRPLSPHPLQRAAIIVMGNRVSTHSQRQAPVLQASHPAPLPLQPHTSAPSLPAQKRANK